MRVGAIGVIGRFSDETGRLHRFVVSSLMAHAALIAVLVSVGPLLAVPAERPLKVQILPAPASRPAPAEGPAGPPIPGAKAGPADNTPELIEAPKPKVEQAPRSKQFAGIYDRRGGPGSKTRVPGAETETKKAPRVEGGTLRGEEAVRPPAVPPSEVPPAITLPAAPQQPQPSRVEPIPQGRTALVQPAAPVPSLRDQVASLGLTYRPPVEEPGTANDPSGRGDSGLDTFRFKYATWGLAVKHDIERAWKVPGYGISSLAIVRFVILPDGRIRNVGLERSSGLAILDRAATNAITDAAPFRPFPPRMREENPGGIEIVVNFYYREGRGILQWE